MRTALPLASALVLFCDLLFVRPNMEEGKSMAIKRITPVLFVSEIEPCLKFWTERVGFEKTVEVPEGNRLGFVMLQKDGAELMYQSYSSVDKDLPAIASTVRKGPTFLYIEVENLDAIKSAVKGSEFYMSERTTSYGAREIGIKDPAGHYIMFAQFSSQPQH